MAGGGSLNFQKIFIIWVDIGMDGIPELTFWCLDRTVVYIMYYSVVWSTEWNVFWGLNIIALCDGA